MDINVKIITLGIILIVIVILTLGCYFIWLNKRNKDTDNSLKIVNDNKLYLNKIDRKSHGPLVNKALLLLAQSEFFDDVRSELSEDELLKLNLSFRLERRSSLKQLKMAGIIEINTPKDNPISN